MKFSTVFTCLAGVVSYVAAKQPQQCQNIACTPVSDNDLMDGSFKDTSDQVYSGNKSRFIRVASIISSASVQDCVDATHSFAQYVRKAKALQNNADYDKNFDQITKDTLQSLPKSFSSAEHQKRDLQHLKDKFHRSKFHHWVKDQMHAIGRKFRHLKHVVSAQFKEDCAYLWREQRYIRHKLVRDYRDCIHRIHNFENSNSSELEFLGDLLMVLLIIFVACTVPFWAPFYAIALLAVLIVDLF